MSAKSAAGPRPEDASDSDAEGTPTPTPTPDPVPDGVRALLEVFGGPLSEVRFPDIDRSVLEAAADAVRAADTEVHRLFKELEAAQSRLTEERARLGKLAERGIAYAKVFAAEDAKLLASLHSIVLSPPKKPGRKPKVSAPPPLKKAKSEPTPKLLSDDKLSA